MRRRLGILNRPRVSTACNDITSGVPRKLSILLSISDECGSGYSKMNRTYFQEIEEHSVTTIVEPKNTVIAARDTR